MCRSALDSDALRDFAYLRAEVSGQHNAHLSPVKSKRLAGSLPWAPAAGKLDHREYDKASRAVLGRASTTSVGSSSGRLSAVVRTLRDRAAGKRPDAITASDVRMKADPLCAIPPSPDARPTTPPTPTLGRKRPGLLERVLRR